jgi:glutathione synthase/RimK-type ligase-like ATP-grasp enzyme
MNQEIILILSGSEDVHANWVEDKLRERQADFLRFTPAQFPQEATISLSYLPSGQTQYSLKVGERIIDLQKIKAIWNRRPDSPIPHPEFTDESMRKFLRDECAGFIQDAFSALECLWFPAPPSILQRASLKGLQLKLAAEIGFNIPPTLIANSAEDFIEFYNQNNGQIISKVAGPYQLRNLRDDFGRYTELVSFQDLAHTHALQFCPIIFQAYIPKLVELRITVVGKTVLAAEIHSQKSNHARHDWRRHDFSTTQYWPHELPHEIAEKCISLTEKLGLSYGAIDMILTPEKEYVFVEINPNGQYLWIEKMTGLPISDAICDFLIAGKPEKQFAISS